MSIGGPGVWGAGVSFSGGGVGAAGTGKRQPVILVTIINSKIAIEMRFITAFLRLKVREF